MVWPLARRDALEFVKEKREVLVVEEFFRDMHFTAFPIWVRCIQRLGVTLSRVAQFSPEKTVRVHNIQQSAPWQDGVDSRESEAGPAHPVSDRQLLVNCG